MSSDEIIKNPRRKNKPVVRTKHVPEWIRLGKEPIVYEANPSDVMFLNNKKRSPMKSSAVSEQTPVQPPKVKRASAVESSVPQHTKISVGQSRNWFEEDPSTSEEILYEEIADPPESEEAEESVEESVTEQVLDSGEYGVLVKGFVVMKTFVLKEAEAMIEKILFDQVPEFSKVSIDDISLIMRLPLKVGVLAVLE